MAKQIKALLHQTRGRLMAGGIEQSGLEARRLLQHFLHLSDAGMIADGEQMVEAPEEIDRAVARRLSGEPLSRILGEREFWGLSFTVTPDVLDPRPDTETVVEAALGLFGERPPARILDLGTGSGCILIALLHEWQEAWGVGIDKSPAALAVARENAERNNVAGRVTFVEGDFFDGVIVDDVFDLIVSNPPYIPSGDIAGLESSVRNHDPILALDGGEDGLRAYEAIVLQTKSLLAPRGAVVFEVGIGQAADVMRLGETIGLSALPPMRDLAGIERVVILQNGDK